jgi:hypothetical protein
VEASRNRRLFELGTLGHPLWWAALALLVVNDRFLKGGGLAPGWLTGKLSDFAFLLVAPVLASALIPVRLPGRRAIAVGVVSGLFVAAKVSPAVSVALVATLARLGLRWRLWPDPTDLLALSVLPFTLRLLRARPPASPDFARRWRERIAVILGAVACLATSAPPRYQHEPFLFNAAPTGATVRVTWVLRAVSCPPPEAPHEFQGFPVDAGRSPAQSALAELAASLTPGDLDDPRELTLARGQVAALDGIPPPGVSPVGVCAANLDWGGDSPCFAAILESPPAAPVLMVAQAHWEEESDGGGFFSCQSPPSPVSRCAASLNPERDPGSDAVTLKQVHGALAFVAGSKVELGPVDPAAISARATSPTACRELRASYRALIAPSPCATNADCVGLQGVDIPGDPVTCLVATNPASAATLARVETDWSAACVVGPQSCPLAHPAACVAGACAAVCPDVNLPVCQPACLPQNSRVGERCEPGGACLNSDRNLCYCVDGGISCVAQVRPSADCPLDCLPGPGGGSLIDGGVIAPPSADAAGADAGRVDAGRLDAATARSTDAHGD